MQAFFVEAGSLCFRLVAAEELLAAPPILTQKWHLDIIDLAGLALWSGTFPYPSRGQQARICSNTRLSSTPLTSQTGLQTNQGPT